MKSKNRFAPRNVMLKRITVMLCAVLFCSCSTREDIFDSYNNCFVHVERDSAFVLTDANQGGMLRDAYEISLADVPATTLALSCPAECDSYEWKITRMDDASEVLSDGQNGTYKWNTQNIGVYISKSDDCMLYREAKQSGQSCSYRIQLSVIVGNRNFYDSALLVISVDKTEADTEESRMATLSLSATGIPDEYFRQESAGRSILPDTPYTPGSSGLTFYLSGISETGKRHADEQVTLKQNGGSYDFDGTVKLDNMLWDLTLTAYKDGDKTKPVLRGFCTSDLRSGSGTATFTLSPDNLKTPGSVSITGSFNAYGNVSSYTAGMYKKSGGTVHETTATGITGEGETSFLYECASVAPGTYLYKMVFKNADGVISGCFADTLVVEAGNALSQPIGLLDVVNKKPGKPTDFKVTVADNSENPYTAHLTWTRGGGETGYEIELTAYQANGTDIAAGYPKIYGKTALNPSAIDFVGSGFYAGEGGTLVYGDTETYIRLDSDTAYALRICARNNFGTSAWTDSVAKIAADGTVTMEQNGS